MQLWVAWFCKQSQLEGVAMVNFVWWKLAQGKLFMSDTQQGILRPLTVIRFLVEYQRANRREEDFFKTWNGLNQINQLWLIETKTHLHDILALIETYVLKHGCHSIRCYLDRLFKHRLKNLYCCLLVPGNEIHFWFIFPLVTRVVLELKHVLAIEPLLHCLVVVKLA